MPGQLQRRIESVFHVFSMLAGLVLGVIVAGFAMKEIPKVRAELMIPMLAAIGAGFGAIIGMLLVMTYRRLDKNSKRRREERKPRPVRHAVFQETPAPFRERLAQFADSSPEEVLVEDDSFESKMPFWSIAGLFSRLPPKPVSYIREILVRIRKTVRG